MKIFFLIFALLATFITSCDKEESVSDNFIVQKDTLKIPVNDLKFKLFPTSNNQFRFTIYKEENKSYELILKQNNQEVSKTLFIEDISSSYLTNADVKHNFAPYSYYNLLIRSISETDQNIIEEEFIIYGYKHIYLNPFRFEKIASINQRLDFDISPSRKVIFYEDYIQNKPVLKRLWLDNNKLETLDEDFMSLLIRAKDDNHLIVKTKFYEDRYLEEDSTAILIYDLVGGKSSFLDWGSSSYGRHSRVVNDHIFISNPLSSQTISLINLNDNSKKEYPNDISFLREYNYDNHYRGNEIFDFSSFTFENKLPFLNNNSSIVYFDKKSDTYIVTEGFSDIQSPDHYMRILVYRNNKIIFEDQFEEGRTVSFPKIINMENNKIVFYQSFDYHSDLRLDGYYVLDLNNKQIELLHTENKDYQYVKFDFFIYDDENSFISVRSHEIYKITME